MNTRLNKTWIIPLTGGQGPHLGLKGRTETFLFVRVDWKSTCEMGGSPKGPQTRRDGKTSLYLSSKKRIKVIGSNPSDLEVLLVTSLLFIRLTHSLYLSNCTYHVLRLRWSCLPTRNVGKTSTFVGVKNPLEECRTGPRDTNGDRITDGEPVSEYLYNHICNGTFV